MSEILNKFIPRFIVDDKGQKTEVVIDFNDYNKIMELIEDLEDSMDLLKAELEASEFTPYEEFRNRWLNP